jgi:hypothetical protein
MCVNNPQPWLGPDEVEGWKVFEVSTEGDLKPYFEFTNKSFPDSQTIKFKHRDPEDKSVPAYFTSGFHFCKTRPSISAHPESERIILGGKTFGLLALYTVRRVTARKITCVSADGKELVAQEILIHPEENEE